jgi:hypothetical protein
MQGGLTELLSQRGLDAASLGLAYLLFIASVCLTVVLFMLSRMLVVVSPNRPARRYGLYVVMLLVSLIIAAVLENELVPAYAATLDYSMFPQLLVLLMLHLWIYYDQQPWLVSIGASAMLATAIAYSSTAALTGVLQLSHGLTLALLAGLLGYLWYNAVSTKRGFVSAKSIYIDSKEAMIERIVQQRPWLGLSQWVALACASIVVAMLNSILQGSGFSEVPATAVLGESILILVITGLVCAIPATTYWLAHKHWMPELTRFVWLVWVVVGFAFTYGNFLTSLDAA